MSDPTMRLQQVKEKLAELRAPSITFQRRHDLVEWAWSIDLPWVVSELELALLQMQEDAERIETRDTVIAELRKRLDEVEQKHSRQRKQDVADLVFKCSTLSAALEQVREMVDREVALTDRSTKGGQSVGTSPRMMRSMALELQRILSAALAGDVNTSQVCPRCAKERLPASERL
jgi:hypothetical protein